MNNDIIKEAFIQEAQERCIGYYNQAAKHRFSIGYLINRHKIIKDYKKSLEKSNMIDSKSLRLKPVLRLNLIIIAVLLAILASAAFAIYTIINGFSFRTHPTHSVVEYLEIETGKTSIEEEYYIPESVNLSIINTQKLSNLVLTEYRYYDKILTLNQITIDYSFNLNTENISVEPLDVNENKGFYIKVNEETYICWTQDGYIFSLVGDINKDEALNLVKCTKIK